MTQERLSPLRREIESLRSRIQDYIPQLAGGRRALYANITLTSQTLSMLLETSSHLLAAASSTLGECRVETPYAEIRPIIDSNKQLHWCCTHDPWHCVP